MKKEIVIYQAQSGAVEVRLDAQKETIFLTQQQVAELFGVQKAAISKHVKNIFATKELERGGTVSILETVQSEGNRQIKRKVEYYNLDLILSVGYRVKSPHACAGYPSRETQSSSSSPALQSLRQSLAGVRIIN